MQRRKIGAATWALVRNAYVQGEGSLRELAERFGVNPKAVQSRCLRERWSKQIIEARATLEKAVDVELKAKAGTIAEQAALFAQRTVDESHGWLDAVAKAKTLLRDGDLNGLKKLLDCWQIPVNAGRKLLQRHEPRESITIAVLAAPGECYRPPGWNQPPEVSER